MVLDAEMDEYNAREMTFRATSKVFGDKFLE
jgi:hypothetical protein